MESFYTKIQNLKKNSDKYDKYDCFEIPFIGILKIFATNFISKFPEKHK